MTTTTKPKPTIASCPQHPQSTVWHHADGDRCGICAYWLDGREPIVPVEPRDIRSFATYRQSAAKTDDEDFAPLDYYVGSMAEKAGELFGAVKKVLHHGHPRSPAFRAYVVETAGDLLWFMDRALVRLDIDLEEVAAFNERKRKGKWPEAFGEKEPKTVDPDLAKNPHTEHCCRKCRYCKYSETTCPVVAGRQKQSFECTGNCDEL